MLPPYVTPSATRLHTYSDSVKSYVANVEEDAELFHLAVQSSSSNCCMLIHTDNWGTVCLVLGPDSPTYLQDFT